jgi:DNA-binding Lrp family transcriptional regulator
MPEMLIEAAYKSIAPSHASPIQIAEEVKRSTGTALPGSSLHRVIHRLEERGIIERVGTTSAWRYAQKDGREPANPSGGVVVDLGKRGVQ